MDESWMMAQQSVLGACLIEEKVVGKIIFGLSEDDFTGANRSIYIAMRDLYTTGKRVDPVTVLHALNADSSYRDYVVQLMDITPTAAGADSYIGICRERSRLHRYHEIGQELAEVRTSKEASALVAKSAQLIQRRAMACSTMGQALHEFFDIYNRKKEYLRWFLAQLDGQLALEFGDFCLVGGRPSSAKTAFALEAAAYWGVVCGYRVGVYSCETSRQKLTNRMVSAMARVPLDAVKHSKLSDKELDRVCTLASKISEAPIDLIAAAGKTVAEIQAYAMERRHQIVIVDYLQIVSAPGESEYAQVSAISKALHVMCQSLGIFCLGLCQLNRTKGARPALEDLRSSGQLEQDADAVLFLHKQEGKDDERELIIAKNKEGECRSTKLHFDGPIQHFSYIGRGDAPLKGYDYLDAPAYRCPPGELEQLPMDSEVTF